MNRILIASIAGPIFFAGAGFVQAAPNTTNPSEVEKACRSQGGTYFPPDSDGGYGCVFPDGRIIYCGGRLPGCTVIPPRTTQPPPSLGGPAWAGLWKSIAIEQEVIDLNDKMETVLSGMNALLDAVGGGSEPDLVPLPRSDASGREAYCRMSSDGQKLQVLVHNRGGSPAGPSVTRVEFQTGASTNLVSLATAPLTGSSPTTLVEFGRPVNCTGTGGPGYCDFQISVDVSGAIVESDEENNDAVGTCAPSIL